MITQRDRDIVKFVEDYKSITIKQCSRLMWSHASSGYKIAQKRLSNLVNNRYLKIAKTDTQENLYYIDKKLSHHDLLINGFYIELLTCGASDVKFAKDKSWLDGKIISDAFFAYIYNDKLMYNILEVCWTHKNIPINNYEKLYSSDEGKQLIGACGEFPTIVVLDSYDRENYKSDILKIVRLDYNFNNLPMLFMN